MNPLRKSSSSASLHKVKSTISPSTYSMFTCLSRYSAEVSSSQLVVGSELGPTNPGEKPRVVVLGSGWAGCRLMKDLDTSIYDVVCVSPRNHMVFTPLLASTCVGTLEFRSVAEPIGRIQPAISREPGSYFFLANCTGIDADKHLVRLLLFRFLITSLSEHYEFIIYIGFLLVRLITSNYRRMDILVNRSLKCAMPVNLWMEIVYKNGLMNTHLIDLE